MHSSTYINYWGYIFKGKRCYSNTSLFSIAPFPPSNLSVSQNGLNNVLVSWTPSDGVERYIIYYQQDGRRKRSFKKTGTSTSSTISKLNAGSTYSISVVAATELHSTEVGPVNITIGRYFDLFLKMCFEDGVKHCVFLCFADSLEIRVYRKTSSLYAGQVVKLSCSITLFGTLTGTPTFNWQGPGSLPTPVISSNSEWVVTSALIINSLNSSHEGRYTCTAALTNFPFSVEDYTTLFINNRSMFVFVVNSKI